MSRLPWYFRVDEWMHQHIDKHLGQHVGLWRLVYTGPRKWFCDYADRRLEIADMAACLDIAKTMCLKPMQQVTTSSSGATAQFYCRCPRCKAEEADA